MAKSPIRTALLLLNTGTPDDPSIGAVRRYLRQFLSDPRVIEGSALKRKLLVEGLILPVRARRSASAYREIFDGDVSPLLRHSQELAKRLGQQLGDRVRVDIAMRYGNPSIEDRVAALVADGIDRIVAFPLFPQYASASAGSALQELYRVGGSLWNTPAVQTVPPFFDHPAYIEALANLAEARIAEQGSSCSVIFSYHGLPLSHLHRSGSRCQPSDVADIEASDCCAEIDANNRFCYRAQCLATTRALSKRLGVLPNRQVVAFQSRIGAARWLGPYLSDLLRTLPARGVKRAVLISPSFVADCLETIEELQGRAAELFVRSGGQRLDVVESLNATNAWVKGAAEIAQQASGWL